MVAQLSIANKAASSIGNAIIPPEGPQTVPILLDFTTVTGQPAYLINVSDFYQKGPGQPGLSNIQGFFADNTASIQPMSIKVSVTGQNIVVPAGAQGYFPLLSPKSGTILISNTGNVKTLFEFYNVPMPAMLWGESQGGGTYTPNGYLETADQNLASLIADGALAVKIAGQSTSAASVIWTGNIAVGSGRNQLLNGPGNNTGFYISNINVYLAPDTFCNTGVNLNYFEFYSGVSRNEDPVVPIFGINYQVPGEAFSCNNINGYEILNMTCNPPIEFPKGVGLTIDGGNNGEYTGTGLNITLLGFIA